ncbi:MAG: glutamyl-tRNA amidotransferase [Deltaproteobacteria bacterium HGW-Deltaproteobacteria-19]|nr:MAG: glutamyl-tRNA amidotransferase [Deltaproteobacteria bacterium HGW-Deltaproteobacteria-19]
MTMKKQMEQDMIQAAKAKDKVRLSALRLIKTAMHNREIDLKRDLNEPEILQLLSGMVKQRKDSIEQFAKGGRADLVAQEEAELVIIQSFMPQQLSREEVEAEIDKAVSEAGASSVKDMGKVMKVLMPRITGKADGKMVGELVKARLAG